MFIASYDTCVPMCLLCRSQMSIINSWFYRAFSPHLISIYLKLMTARSI